MQYTLPIRRVHKRHACQSWYTPDRRLPYASRRASSGECRILFPHLSGQAVFCPASRGHPPFFPCSAVRTACVMRGSSSSGVESMMVRPSISMLWTSQLTIWICPTICCNQFQHRVTFVRQEHFFPVPKDAAVADSKTFTDFSDAQTAHSEFKNFPAARCQSNSRYTRLRFLIEVMQQLNVAMNAEAFRIAAKCQYTVATSMERFPAIILRGNPFASISTIYRCCLVRFRIMNPLDGGSAHKSAYIIAVTRWIFAEEW